MCGYTEKFLTYLRHELGRAHLTVEAYNRDLSEFSNFITDNKPQDFHPEDITQSDIRLWVSHLAAEKKEKPTSMRRKIQSLRSFFRFLCKSGVRRDNPALKIPLPKLPSKLPQFIKASEMEQLLNDNHPDNIANFSPRAAQQDSRPSSVEDVRNHLMVEILYTTGIRRAELFSLSDNDIYFSHSEMRVIGKRSKPRIIPLHPDLLNKISLWQQLRNKTWETKDDDSPLFTSSNGHRLSISSIENIVKKKLANISSGRKSPHTLRHTFATAMLNGGAGINDVKELLGHASISSTQIYTHVSFAEVSKAYKKAHPRAKSE